MGTHHHSSVQSEIKYPSLQSACSQTLHYWDLYGSIECNLAYNKLSANFHSSWTWLNQLILFVKPKLWCEKHGSGPNALGVFLGDWYCPFFWDMGYWWLQACNPIVHSLQEFNGESWTQNRVLSDDCYDMMLMVWWNNKFHLGNNIPWCENVASQVCNYENRRGKLHRLQMIHLHVQ